MAENSKGILILSLRRNLLALSQAESRQGDRQESHQPHQPMLTQHLTESASLEIFFYCEDLFLKIYYMNNNILTTPFRFFRLIFSTSPKNF